MRSRNPIPTANSTRPSALIPRPLFSPHPSALSEQQKGLPGGSPLRGRLCRGLVAAAEALVERLLVPLLVFRLRDVLDDRDLGDQEVLRAVVHFLLAEREALPLGNL